MLRRTVFLGTLILAACSSAENKKGVKTPVIAMSSATNKDGLVNAAPAKRHRELNESPNGDVATITRPGNVVEIVDKTKAKRTLESALLHPPAGEKGLIGISAQTVTYLDDGTLVVGVGDGTVVALDGHDNPKWSVGFRGAITGIVPANEDRIIITTQRGVIAFLKASSGEVLWEKHPMAGALAPAVFGADERIYAIGPRGIVAYSGAGALAYSHAATLSEEICCQKKDEAASFEVDATGHFTGQGLDIRFEDPHPGIADTTPVALFEYEKVLDEKVLGILATGPNELLLWVRGKKNDELVRYGGGTTKRFPIPALSSKAERMGDDEKPKKLPLTIDALVMGPNGNPWLVARALFPPYDPEYPWVQRPAKAVILELADNNVRERKDLQAQFDETWVTSSENSRIQCASEGTAKIFCFGDETQMCAIYEGGQPTLTERKNQAMAIRVIGKNTYIIPNSGLVERLEGQQFIPIATPTDSFGIADISGTSENDLWFTSKGGYVAHHWDGKSFQATSLPLSTTVGFAVRSANDVWSRDGLMHWDGTRWSIIADSQRAAELILRPSGETWVGNYHGLFRAKPSTRPSVQLPSAKFVDTKPLSTPEVLALGPTQTGYTMTKTSLVIKNAAPVTTAKRAETARDGTLWIESWDRLVEVDFQGNTTVIDKDEKRIAFDRWFYPESPGRGLLVHRHRESEDYNVRDELRIFESGKATKSPFQLSGHDIVAISGNAQGAAWILGSVEAGSPYQLLRPSADELGIHALVRPDERSLFRPVVGLPAVAYRDIAVTPDGGAFLVGALNAGPMGEGVIVHARGPMGAKEVVRYRIQSSLLAVAAVSNDEAWAVGAMGLVVHIKGNVIERRTIPSQPWLRAIVANTPNDIWIGGDEGTLLHFDGKNLRPMNQPLGPRAAFSGLAVSHGVVWATSPSGIVRITNNGTTMPM